MTFALPKSLIFGRNVRSAKTFSFSFQCFIGTCPANFITALIKTIQKSTFTNVSTKNITKSSFLNNSETTQTKRDPCQRFILLCHRASSSDRLRMRNNLVNNFWKRAF